MRRVKELETELRILHNELYSINSKGNKHARHNKKIARYVSIIRELERISIKWKIKKLLRRTFKHGKN